MTTCNFCQQEMTRSIVFALDEWARRKGFCNWACMDLNDPLPEEVIQATIGRSRMKTNPQVRPFRCFCRVCNSEHEMALSIDEYKMLAPLGTADDGRLNIACGRCA